jgi:excisionase family DNA binding protein
MSDRLTGRLVSPLARASARKRAYTADETNDETSAERHASSAAESPRRAQPRGGEDTTKIPSGNNEEKKTTVYQRRARPRTGTLGGSNRMLSAREVAAILSVPERTVREKWREWDLPAYRIGKHLRWKEREVHAWIDRHAA